MTLQCTCGSYALEIVSQSYPENGNAYETYKCEICGRTRVPHPQRHDERNHAEW